MVIEDSDGRGVDVVGTTGGASGMVEGAKDVASSVGTVEGATGVGGMISIGISTYSACGGCSSCGNFGDVGIFGALGGAT